MTMVYVTGDIKCPRCRTKLAGFNQWMESSDEVRIGYNIPLEIGTVISCVNINVLAGGH